MSDFLSNLADTIEDQYSLGENNNRTLKLGDLSKQIDQSQRRQYLEQGYLRLDPYNAKPKQLEILFQEPDITVLVKKRAFSSLSENFRLDHMDKDEKLFYKASKILFQNKCKQISALEKLSKINRISSETGQFSDQLVPLILSIVDSANLIDSASGGAGVNSNLNTDLGKLNNVVNKVRNLYAYSDTAGYTSWIESATTLSQNLFGQGTGVIEFNNVTGLTAGTSINFEPSTFNLTISDPYNIMSITNYDIENALSDAANLFYNKKTYQFANEGLSNAIDTAKQKLNNKRILRGASKIEFIVNADTILSKKVRAVIDGAGVEINFSYDPAAGLAGLVPGLGGVVVSPESLRGGTDVGEDGLDNSKSNITTNIDVDTSFSTRRLSSDSEVSLFANVISKIYNDIQLKVNSNSITKQNSQLTNYARRKLKTHYLGKQIIQSMDQVHIYISSKSRQDDKVLGGLQNAFTGYGFLKKFNNQFANFQNQFDSLFNPAGNANFQIEKAVFVGSDFPNWLWTLLRNQFVNDAEGTHVFAGVVETADSTFNNGMWSVTVNGKDNTSYLEMGKVNLNPSIDVFNGSLLDPLTPFKTKFDNVSGTFKNEELIPLDENKELLDAGFARFKAGLNAGKKVTAKNLIQDHDIQRSSGVIRQVLYTPDGFVKRWKEGIGTFSQFSGAFNVNTDNNAGSPSVTKEPFAGQDIMNVISLAITGIPYNYATFYKAAREANGYGRDPQTGENSSKSFYDSLTTDLKKNNLLWGNFIPFKNLVMDEQSFQKVINSQLTILNTNDQITQKLNRVKEINNYLKLLGGNAANAAYTSGDATRAALQEELFKVKSDLGALNSQILGQLKSSNQNLSVVGNDVSFNYDEFLNNDVDNQKSLTNSNIRRDLRRKINFLTRRMSWQVRANEDKNYLIVDDSYDKDYDINAFEKALNGPEGLKLFNSEFSSVKEKIKTVANFLNLEVFADTQGHIRVRPPQYNRIPSSIFYRLIQLKKFSGIQFFPQFIEDLFVDQIQYLISQIEIVEDQIRLDAATLGKVKDQDVYNLVRGENYTLASGVFTFISDEISGTVLEIKSIFSENNIDQNTQLQNTKLGDTLSYQASIKSAFTASDQINLLINQDTTTETFLSSDRINNLIDRLQTKTGQIINLDNFLSPSLDGSISVSSTKIVDPYKVAKDISSKVSERQKLIKQAANALKSAQEAISLDSNDTSAATKLLMPDILRNSNIPEVFESMLEDETYDDYGTNSGKRYIVKNSQIISMTIREEPPAFNMVEVNGYIPYLSSSDLPSDLNISITPGGTGGNAMITAAAVDYDMWRMYGLRNTQTVPAPFLSNPKNQCEPFAAMLLSRARQNILQGRISLVGNEFMQSGDVIYLEDKDLLFYVESVNHSFSYGSKFTTDIVVKYGHVPGEYIPTTLDIVGKLLYKNRDSSTYINYRQDTSFNQQSLGVLVLDHRSSSALDPDNVYKTFTSGTYGDHNIKLINDILYTAYFAINSGKDPNSSVKAKLELRIYYNSSIGGIDSGLDGVRSFAKNILIGAAKLNNDSPIAKTELTLDSSDVIISDSANVDISGKSEFRSPSQKAVDMARNIAGSVSVQSGQSNQLNAVLYGYIIDCWISFENNSNG